MVVDRSANLLESGIRNRHTGTVKAHLVRRNRWSGMFKPWILFPKAKEALGLRKLGPKVDVSGRRGLPIEAYYFPRTSPFAIFKEKSPKSQPTLVFVQFSQIDFSFHDISPRTMIRP